MSDHDAAKMAEGGEAAEAHFSELDEWRDRALKAERERDEARADADLADKQRNAALADFGPALQRAQRERDEARRELARWRASYAEECAEVARLRHDPKADARPVIEEWKAKAERAWGDAAVAQERLEQAMALLPEAKTALLSKDDGKRVAMCCRIEAFREGQPAPAKPVVDDAMVERAGAAHTAAMVAMYAHKPGDPEPIHPMRAALVAALEGRG